MLLVCIYTNKFNTHNSFIYHSIDCVISTAANTKRDIARAKTALRSLELKAQA